MRYLTKTLQLGATYTIVTSPLCFFAHGCVLLPSRWTYCRQSSARACLRTLLRTSYAGSMLCRYCCTRTVVEVRVVCLVALSSSAVTEPLGHASLWVSSLPAINAFSGVFRVSLPHVILTLCTLVPSTTRLKLSKRLRGLLSWPCRFLHVVLDYPRWSSATMLLL